MATTAQEIFNAAMGLIDEISETTSLPDAAETAGYKARTLLVLNALRGELYPFSDTFVPATAGTRPISAVISDFTTALDLDDYICQTIMPYGLAAHLLLNESPNAASFFQQRYEELKSGLAKGLPQESEDITDLYGGIEYGNYSRW